MTLSSRRATGVARSAAAVIALVALGSTPAGAQDGPSRAFERIFAQGEPSGAGNLTVSVVQGVDALTGGASDAARHSPTPLGAFLGVTPTINLSAGTFGISGGGILRRYADTGQFRLFDGHAGFGTQRIGRRAALKLSSTVTYAPYSQFLTVPGVPAAGSVAGGATPERAGADRPVTTFVSSVDAGRQLTRRLVFSANYSWQYRHLGPATDATDTLGDMQTHALSARLNRQLGRYMVLFAGYGTRITQQQDDRLRPFRAHDISLGVNRTQQFTFSQRTRLDFSTGSSIVETANRQRVFLIGSAALRYDLSRTWMADVSAHRGVGYLEGVRDPVFSNSMSLSLGGTIGPRLDLLAEGGYSKGDIGLSSASSGFRAYSGTMRLRGRLTRRLAAYGEWVVYQQRFDSRLDLPATFDPFLTRRGLRAGVTMNLPLQSGTTGQRGAR